MRLARSAQSLLLTMVFAALAGCSAGSGDDSGTGGDGSGAGSSSDGPGSTTGSGFGTGGGSSGSGFNCTDPACIGNTPQGNCDTGLAIDSNDAMDGARAIGICQASDGNTWGVVSAQWVRSDGQPLSGILLEGKGILNNFGNLQPREGGSMLALSSGAARSPDDPGFQDPAGYWKDCGGDPLFCDPFNPPPAHGAPPGYPKESPSCPGVTTGSPYDSAGLRLQVKTPTDAKSISFDFDFYTYEFPAFICDQYNDFFVAMVNPKIGSLPDGNISFDSQGNTISVNAGFLQVCSPQLAGGKQFDCPLGPSELTGTGFEEHAATSWLTTKAPIEAPGSTITLDFLVWDSGDGVLDSTVLIDNFRFEATETDTGTAPVPQ
jgi:hypothetical protein